MDSEGDRVSAVPQPVGVEAQPALDARNPTLGRLVRTWDHGRAHPREPILSAREELPDDDRREMDSAIEKQFWFRSGPLEGLEYSSNYNIYWSQEGTLRSWQIDQGVDVQLRNFIDYDNFIYISD